MRKMIHIKWVRSAVGFSRRQKEVIRSLGFRRLNQILERLDTPQVRGLVGKVPHLVEIVTPAAGSPMSGVPEYVVHRAVAPPPQPAVTESAAVPLEVGTVGAATGSAAAEGAISSTAEKEKKGKPLIKRTPYPLLLKPFLRRYGCSR